MNQTNLLTVLSLSAAAVSFGACSSDPVANGDTGSSGTAASGGSAGTSSGGSTTGGSAGASSGGSTTGGSAGKSSGGTLGTGASGGEAVGGVGGTPPGGAFGGGSGGSSAGSSGSSAGGSGGQPACATGAVLFSQSGLVFEVVSAGQTTEVQFGTVGAEYSLLTIDLTLTLGSWRTELFDREVLNHNQLAITRNAAQSNQRYIAGLGAQIRPMDMGLARTALFFARVDLEPRPPGMGYTSYTTFRKSFAWQPGAEYQVHVALDAVAHQQRLRLRQGGATVLSIQGAIDYFVPSLTTSGWNLELGTPGGPGRDVSPVGSKFSDVVICGA